MAGTQVLAEMAEQGKVLAQIAAKRPELHEVIRAALPREIRGVLLVARGSSDHVAIHARYLLELATGKPVAMMAPSIVTRYHRVPDVRDYLAIPLSQSGRTPEIVEVAKVLRAAGAKVLSISNDTTSPLAQHSDVALTVGTSKELAVPATKTVTGSLALAVLLAEAAGAEISSYTGGQAGWDALPGVCEQVLADTAGLDTAVDIFTGATAGVHLARGLTYAAALEGALKAKETNRRIHDGYSSADFLHGPLTVSGAAVAVVAYGAAGPVLADVNQTVRSASELGSPVIGVGDPAVVAGLTDAVHLPVPAGVGEALAVIPLVIRGQQLAIAGALACGIDPDAPAGLHKVTATD